MAPSNDICYYGLHFGCLNATRDAECTRCAERLTHAVEHVLHPAREALEAYDIAREELPSDIVSGRQNWREVQVFALNQTK